MELNQKIEYLKKAKDENKLIIFVGAGVSKNSHLPDWSELVRNFADKLNYHKDTNDGNEYKFSSDEYLKIPQYYYNICEREKYLNVIKEVLDIDCTPNDINKIIFKLNPKHIITTNYDRLLERTIVDQRRIFDVISKDKDFLNANKSNYIIKMHGDIKELDNIVLKENDYLNYSQNHVLIETFIKSLLVTNTFLFVGYSLNDYNLKQIISWVENLAKSYTDIGDRPKNFIVQEVDNQFKDILENYYEKNNVFIINPNNIDNNYKPSIESKDLGEVGRRLYNTLMYINDYPINIIDKLYYGYKYFDKCRRVSIYDLFKVYKFKYAEVLSGSHLCFSHIEDDEYLVIKDIIHKRSEKEKFIRTILIKSGIKYIQIQKDIKDEEYCLVGEEESLSEDVNEDKYIEFRALEVNLNYIELDKQVKLMDDDVIKAYYLFVLGRLGESKECLDKFGKDIFDKDIYNLLLYKFNLGLINQLLYYDNKNNYEDFRYIHNNYSKNTMYHLNYINIIFNNNKDELIEVENLKDKHIKEYLKLNNSIQLGNIKYDLYKIITIAYNYYFYIKENGIFLDYFSNVNVFFNPFIESILCTYSPKTKRVRTETLLPDYNEYEKYKLNKYDLDILIKYSKDKDLEEYIQKYQISELSIDNDIDLIKNLSNLCQYIKLYPNRYNIGYLKKLILILSIVNIDKYDLNKAINDIEGVLVNKDGNLHIFIFTEICLTLNKLLKRNNEIISKGSFNFVINELFTDTVYDRLKGQNNSDKITEFLKSTQKFSCDMYKEKIDSIISNCKVEHILILCDLMNEEQKINARNTIINNIESIHVAKLIRLLFFNILKYDKVIETKIIDQINIYVNEKLHKNSIGTTFPDKLNTILQNIVVLYLLKKGVNIENFKKYKGYYDVLDFIIDPYEFDYKKISIENYNWMNVMRNDKYLNIILDKAKSILGKKLKYNIDNKFADEVQIRLYYKYFELED
jgi:NAD-dependent SIR2 family protein deacetylase